MPPLSLELEQSIHADCGLKVHNFYGTSETGAIAFDASASVDSEGRINISSESRAEGTDIPAWENEFGADPYRTLDLRERFRQEPESWEMPQKWEFL
jgi:hypothetical protein